ncbi:hypothetical protein GCM10009548_01630 [Streptomyces malaysiensis subsp. malaysiensis]|uniref:Uncharacterized protein n=1 Tax=Streptomyces malaysiensis TaxID=92644 RepID=A0ABX6W4I7_STRMQ|nr:MULTISPECIES: hypothetical protein [Streptomyces]QPI56367.1 hypothetical protein I1A49_16710 [Streptomyces solisilvae]UHH17854.1 hypothetical protein LUV23_16825 [Streptomyces sp. HNM0561]
MNDVHKITSLDAAWLPGDVVLDAAGRIRIRSAHPKWVWDYPNEGSLRDARGNLQPPGGALEDSDVPRPLTLLVRDGMPVGGRVTNEGDTPEID